MNIPLLSNPTLRLDNELRIVYDCETKTYFVTYGLTPQKPRHLGQGDSLEEAFNSLSDSVDAFDREYPHVIKNKLENASSVSLTVESKVDQGKNSEYLITISDRSGRSITGTGSNMSRAFSDIADQLSEIGGVSR